MKRIVNEPKNEPNKQKRLKDSVDIEMEESRMCCDVCGISETIKNEFIKRKCNKELCFMCTLIECAKNVLNIKAKQKDLKYMFSCCHQESKEINEDEIMKYFDEISKYETVNEEINIEFVCKKRKCKGKLIKYCLKCKDIICLKCEEKHFSNEHEMINEIEKAVIEMQDEKCKKHGNVKDEYCETCKEMICLTCQNEHFEHNKKSGIKKNEMMDEKIKEKIKSIVRNEKEIEEIKKNFNGKT